MLQRYVPYKGIQGEYFYSPWMMDELIFIWARYL